VTPTSRLLLTVAAVALAVRIVALIAIGPERAAYSDATEYASIARNLVEKQSYVDDQGFRARRPPLYPWFLAMHGGSAGAARWTQALLGAGMCLLVSLLARRVSEPVAWIAGLACAVHPLLAFTSVATLGEAAWMPLAVAEVYLLYEALERGSWRLALAAGAAGGLATLGHAGHQLAWVLIAAGALIAWRPRPWKLLAAYAAMAMVVPGLWMARNAAVLGGATPVTSKAGLDLWEAFSPTANGGPDVAAVQRGLDEVGGDELAADRALRSKAWSGVTAGRVVSLAVKKQSRFWSPVPNFAEYKSWPIVLATAVALVPTTLLLIFGILKARRWPKALVLCGMAVAYTALLHAVFVGSIRYRLMVEPFIVVIAAWAITTMRERREKGEER
jgi:hypothetical protein